MSADSQPIPAEFRPLLVGSAPCYVTGEDQLRIASRNIATGVTLSIFGRMLNLEGRLVPFERRHVPNTDRSEATTDIPIGEGWLVNAAVRVIAGTPARGQCFVSLRLMRGTPAVIDNVDELAAGYVSALNRVVFPRTGVLSSLDGQGNIRAVAGTDPAAGSEIIEAVPTGARWRFLSMSALLVTSATVANRDVQIIIDDGANIVYQGAGATNQAASLSFRYAFGPLGEHIAGAGVNVPQVCTPLEMKLAAGHRIRTSTFNLDATDNWGQPFMLVEEWLDPTS